MRLGSTLRPVVIAMFFAGTVTLIGAWACPAEANPQVARIAKRLSDRSSFQVRVQAALALGASGSEAAVRPLCGALDDETPSVRAAAAAALGRLKRESSKGCVRQRISREGNGSVKTQLERALSRIERDAALRTAANAFRSPTRKSRFYVAVDPTKSKHGRRKEDVELLVQATIRQKLMAEHNVGLAPSGQNKNQFEQLARQNHVDGYLLRPTVESIAYDGANVSVALRLTLFTYPSMALQAEYAPKLSMSGTSETDREAEDKLLQLATETAIQKFLETIK